MGVKTAVAISLVGSLLVAQEPGARRTLGDATIERVRARCGQHPFDLFAAWARGDGGQAVERFLGEDRPPELRRALRAAAVCGLWSDDADVAFGAACHVDERTMDVRDIERYVAIVSPHLFDARQRFDWDTFKHVLDTDQVGRVIAGRPGSDADLRQIFISDLHRSMRAEHIPALCVRVRDDDPVVRDQAFHTMALLALYDDRHRENIAIELLAWPGESAFEVVDFDDLSAERPYDARRIELGPVTGGYPPILRATLQRWYLETDGDPRNENIDTWLCRWARDSAPGADDVPLLLDLLGSPRRKAQWTALRGLRAFGDDGGVRDALSRYGAGPGPTKSELAAAVVARGAVDELRARAQDDPAALLATLELGDQPTWSAWCGRAFGADPGDGLAALEELVAARDEGEFGPLAFPERVHARLRTAVADAAASLDPARLVSVATEFPACRTPELAAACLQRVGVEELTRGVAAFLELYDEPRLRAKLVDQVESGHGAARAVALELLARLGAPEVGDALVVWAGDDADRRALLTRSAAAPSVREHLVEAVRRNEARGVVGWPDLAAMMAASGIPESTCRSWVESQARVPGSVVAPRFEQWVDRLVDGDAVGVLVDSLDLVFGLDSDCDGLGLVDDERVRAHLRRLRDTPGSQVQDVIAELAVGGDPDALAEMAEVRRGHLYGWMDDAMLYAQTLGPQLGLIPYWIDELGTICCRRNGAASAVDGLTGFDASSFAEAAVFTQREQAEAWWQRVGPHLRWSRITERFEVAPH